MSCSVKIVADSIAPCGERLISIQAEYPRIILAELNTHRDLSRNSASSRAIPVERMIQRILNNPGKPVHWGKAQKGMQAEQELDEAGKAAAEAWWQESMELAVAQARKGLALGLHKQVVNRVTEPYQHMVTLISSTKWANLLNLRAHKDADPTFQALAYAMLDAIEASTPTALGPGEWHLPYINLDDRIEAMILAGETTSALEEKARMGLEILKKVSTGRCARTSYVNQEGVRALADDVALHDRLMGAAAAGQPGHWSPFEHVARAEMHKIPSGNFVGFTQYRKMFSHENLTLFPKRKA
jgi:thymidylate synthase ThyX